LNPCDTSQQAGPKLNRHATSTMSNATVIQNPAVLLFF
jgi:hypothetical protein